MLHHPNPNINGTNALRHKNPKTGGLILQDLIAVADTGQELEYQWDKPSDANNYSYAKLSLVRHLPELGWYICSSVYIDELQSSGKTPHPTYFNYWFSCLYMCYLFSINLLLLGKLNQSITSH